MKFPKLKNLALCRFLIALPYLLVTAVFVALCVCFAGSLTDEMIILLVFLLIILMLIMCVICGKTSVFFDMMCISDYVKARYWYDCPKNGTDPEQIKKRIVSRAKRIDKSEEPCADEFLPLVFHYSNKGADDTKYTRIERAVLIYETDYLTADIYDSIMHSANANVHKVRNAKNKALGVNNPRTVSSQVAIILADHIAQDVETLHFINDHDGESYPAECFVELTTGRYFVNVISPTSSALKLIKRIVFGGNIPLKGNDRHTTKPPLIQEICEKTLWQALRENGREDKKITRERNRIISELKNCEVAYFDNELICKLGGRVARFIVEDDLADQSVLTVFIEKNKEWEGQGNSRINKNDLTLLQKAMEEYVRINQNRDCCFDDPDDPKYFLTVLGTLKPKQ